MFFLAGILVASLAVWMWQHARFIRQEIETRMEKATSSLALALIAFVMVFREGVETVIFLQSLLLAGSSPLANFLGGLFGIALAIIFGVVFLRGTVKINLPRFFKVTSAILAILVVKLIANGFHEFFEIELLPSNEAVLQVVGFAARDSTGAAIIALMLAALMLMVLYDIASAAEPDLSSLKPVERRKARYKLAKEKYTKISVGVILTALVASVLAPTLTASDVAVPEPVAVEAQDGWIKVAVPKEDGLYTFNLGEARFIVVMQGGRPYVALDRCYICPPKPYGYNGKVLVCTNCEAPIEVETVGNPGGCNPRVIHFSDEGGFVVINAEDLRQGWRKTP